MFGQFCEILSVWIIPLVLLLVPLAAYLRRIPVYEAFVEGAAEGFQTTLRIMPFLVAMMVAVSIFRASGALEDSVNLLRPLLAFLGVPPELVPLAVMRPLSGTGALGLTTEILNTEGPDSLVGRIASTVMGSTDTTFYVLTVYFGAVGIRKPRYSVAVGLIGDLVGFFGAVYICRILFPQ
ncbi:MAG: spore maturation protein [Negativicutes bacterium]|nr:spore maturation protein [Negativicutes bacterium]